MIAYGRRLVRADAAAEHDRQHREHARRDGGDQAGDEGEGDGESHARLSVRGGRRGRDPACPVGLAGTRTLRLTSPRPWLPGVGRRSPAPARSACACPVACAASPQPASSCAAGGAGGRGVPSAPGGRPRARSRPRRSSRAPRAPPRAGGSPAACSPPRRRAARPRSPIGSSFAAAASLAAFSSCRCPREFASAPSSRFASGYSALALRSSTLRTARARRHVQRARICSGASGRALADRAQQDPHALDAVLLPRRRLRDERDEVVEARAVDGHPDAVGERHHPQPAVRVLGRAREEELLERRLARARGQLLEERDAVVEASLAAGDPRPEALLLLVEVARVDALPLALDHGEAAVRRPG